MRRECQRGWAGDSAASRRAVRSRIGGHRRLGSWGARVTPRPDWRRSAGHCSAASADASRAGTSTARAGVERDPFRSGPTHGAAVRAVSGPSRLAPLGQRQQTAVAAEHAAAHERQDGRERMPATSGSPMIGDGFKGLQQGGDRLERRRQPASLAFSLRPEAPLAAPPPDLVSPDLVRRRRVPSSRARPCPDIRRSARGASADLRRCAGAGPEASRPASASCSLHWASLATWLPSALKPGRSRAPAVPGGGETTGQPPQGQVTCSLRHLAYRWRGSERA